VNSSEVTGESKPIGRSSELTQDVFVQDDPGRKAYIRSTDMIYSASGPFDQELDLVDVTPAPDHWLLPILRYRSVPHNSPETAAPRSIPAARLEEHLTFLVASGWQLVGVTEALRMLRLNNSRRLAALTFDDALLDFLNAFDLLCKFDARATLYVPTGAVGIRVSRWDKGLSRLGWQYIEQVADAGIEIGSQAVSPDSLDGRTDTDIASEVRDSKKEIEDRLGRAINSFCYPAGRSSTRARKAVQMAGYSNACSIGFRVGSSRDDEFDLPRLRVQPSATGNRIDTLLHTGGARPGTSVLRLFAPLSRMARRTVARAASRSVRLR
jgi:peptidoglycan/xylan/chitin deacetylase (PgdA/CDA1 family)